jgi:Predicted membrane-associated Zn-dependent proteases 1
MIRREEVYKIGKLGKPHGVKGEISFMNILPIPALDGGHVLFLIYEIITGRKLGEKFMIRAEYIGISILILLMVVANLNDILRWLGYMQQ